MVSGEWSKTVEEVVPVAFDVVVATGILLVGYVFISLLWKATPPEDEGLEIIQDPPGGSPGLGGQLNPIENLRAANQVAQAGRSID